MTEAELRIEEYKRCWDLFLENVRAVERNEIYAIGAVAAVMAFSAATKSPIVAVASAPLPLLISYLGRMRYVGFGIVAGSLNQYIQEAEASVGAGGWVTYQRARGVGRSLRAMRFLLWKILLGCSAAFAVGIMALHGAALLAS